MGSWNGMESLEVKLGRNMDSGYRIVVQEMQYEV